MTYRIGLQVHGSQPKAIQSWQAERCSAGRYRCLSDARAFGGYHEAYPAWRKPHNYAQVLPPQVYFEPINWYCTALRGTGYATGAPHRLNRGLPFHRAKSRSSLR
jgi:antirestriction protein ArdC